MPHRSSRPGGLARLERIASDRLTPVIPPAPPNPTVTEAMEAWMAMARGYASIVVRQHEFEAVSLSVLRDFDNRLANIEEHIAAMTEEHEVSGDVEEEPPTDPHAAGQLQAEDPTHPR